MIPIAAEGVLRYLGDAAQGTGDVVSLGPFLFDEDILRRLDSCGFLDVSAQLFCLGCLYRQIVSGGFGVGLGALSGFLRVAQLLVQQIDLLLHDLVPVLQRGDHRLLFGQLLAERLIFRFER